MHDSGESVAFYQDIPAFEQYRNQLFHFGCWVNTIYAGSVYVAVEDGEKGTTSLMHSGSGEWEYLSLKGVVSPKASHLRVHIWVQNCATAYIDQATLLV